MKILAVDTSTKHLSVAVTHGQKVLASLNFRPKKDMSLTITLDIERVFRKAGVFLHDIDAFVVGLGPGSFTSLRVGMSMMKAFVMVTGKPVVGISSLDVIAMNVRVKDHRHVCVISDARRGLLYHCVYERKGPALVRWGEYLLKPVDDIFHSLQGEVTFTGDGITVYKDIILKKALESNGRFTAAFEPERNWLPKAKELARLGLLRLARGESDRIETLAPLYLYPEDCQVQRKPA